MGWVAHNIHFHRLAHDMMMVNPISIAWVVGLDIFISFLYGYRLKQLLGTRLSSAWSLVCIGNGLNSILPFRLGDMLRVYYAKHYYQLDMDKTIAATFMERYYDLFLLIIIGTVALLSGPSPYDMTFIYALLILVTCSLLSILIYRLIMSETSALRKWLCRSRIVADFIDCLTTLVSKKNKRQLVTVTVCIWSGLILLYAAFFNLNLPASSVTWQSALILCFTTTLAFAVPYVVAGIGIFESAVIYYLINYMHVLPTEAVALALVFHFVYSLPQVILMGSLFVVRKLRGLPLLVRASKS